MAKLGWRLNYIWRVVVTGWCFLTFSLGGLTLTLTAFPLIRLLWRDSDVRRDKTQLLIHYAFRFFIAQMCFLRAMSVELHGAERLQTLGGALVFCNHPTLIDVVLLISLMPRADCIVKEALWRHRGFGGVIRAAGYLPNRGSADLIDACRQQLNKARPLIIFPEGSRTEPGQPLQFQRGAAHLLLATQADVLPVLLTCSPPSLTKGKRWYEIPPQRFHVTLTALDPVRFGQWGITSESPPLASRLLTRTLQHYFSQQLEHHAKFGTGHQAADHSQPAARRHQP